MRLDLWNDVAIQIRCADNVDVCLSVVSLSLTMKEVEIVGKAVDWGSRKLMKLVSSGKLPTGEAVDVMAAEFAGDACEKYALNQTKWSDHVWEMLRMAGRQRLRGMACA